jgi:glycosyltransferase involved in cell wall biosynthesis
MKILYITPKINNEGGVARVLSIKTNYLIEKFGYEVGIITQNEGNRDFFYDFNSKLALYDIELRGTFLSFLFQYISQVSKVINRYKPDFIVITDNGLKGFLFPVLIKTNIPIVFEVHGSKFNQENPIGNSVFSKINSKLNYNLRSYGITKFKKVIVQSQQSASEWNIENIAIIPNPLSFQTNSLAELTNKKMIFVGRHSYEKGIDRLLEIWECVSKKFPEWKLDIYGSSNLEFDFYKSESISNITFYEPILNIQEKYQESSIFLMTSRFEGYPMALLEAMNCGLPAVCFDCPIGPRAIVINEENGHLVEDGNNEAFIAILTKLIENKELRLRIGKNAHQSSVENHNLVSIMNQWNALFLSFKVN